MANSSGKQRFVIGITVFLIIVGVLLLIGFFVVNQLTSVLGSKCVAEIDIDYPITVEGTPETVFASGYPSSDEVATKIRELNDRDDVASVLVVYNSGGGSTVASKEIYDAMKDLKKPKVAYFRETAASGAYYIATASDYIISEPYALTGNIGVIGTVVSMDGLFEKIGINATSFTSGEHKDIGSPFREMTPEEKQIMQNIVNEIFQDFKRVVLENRKGKINLARSEEIFDGRIFTGKQAKEVGLVDEIGNKRTAILKAAEYGGIKAKKPEDVRICKIEIRQQSNPLFGMQTFIQKFSSEFNTGVYFK